MPKKGANISLSSYDDIFSTQESRQETGEHVIMLPLDAIHPFKNHPFRIVDDEEMQKTAESIREYGVLVPAIVRPLENGEYEMISGHRRRYASMLAGKETMPVIVREMDATMESMNRGAGVLAYPGFLDEAAEKLGGSFFILPSSIHELLFLQDNGTMDRHELTAMVRSINAAEVSPEDQLSDNVYHYDGKDRVFELAEKYDARKAERQTERPSVLQALKEKSDAVRPQPMHARAARAGKEEVL